MLIMVTRESWSMGLKRGLVWGGFWASRVDGGDCNLFSSEYGLSTSAEACIESSSTCRVGVALDHTCVSACQSVYKLIPQDCEI